MPHGETWFSILFPSVHAWLLGVASHLSWPVRNDGLTWIAHAPIQVQHVVGAIIVFALIMLLARLSYAKMKDAQGALVPDAKLSPRTMVELFVSTVYGMMKDVMGGHAAKVFLPLIGTCAFFILVSNLIGLVPGFNAPTGSWNTTVACAIVIFFTTHIFGVKEQGALNYIKHFMGPIWWLAPLMFPIELISHIARPLSLSIRLMANMFADHLVLMIFTGMVPFIVPLPALAMGVMVAVVQTMVFCLLSTVYIAQAVSHDDH